MSLTPHLWKCQRGAKCLVRCPGCPGPGAVIITRETNERARDPIEAAYMAGAEAQLDAIIQHVSRIQTETVLKSVLVGDLKRVRGRRPRPPQENAS